MARAQYRWQKAHGTVRTDALIPGRSVQPDQQICQRMRQPRSAVLGTERRCQGWAERRAGVHSTSKAGEEVPCRRSNKLKIYIPGASKKQSLSQGTATACFRLKNGTQQKKTEGGKRQSRALSWGPCLLSALSFVHSFTYHSLKTSSAGTPLGAGNTAVKKTHTILILHSLHASESRHANRQVTGYEQSHEEPPSCYGRRKGDAGTLHSPATGWSGEEGNGLEQGDERCHHCSRCSAISAGPSVPLSPSPRGSAQLLGPYTSAILLDLPPPQKPCIR